MKLFKNDLECFPYKIQIAWQLTNAVVKKRMDFAGEIFQNIDEHSIDINKIISTDEVHFLSRQLCQQAELMSLGHGNSTYWSDYVTSLGWLFLQE